MNTYNKIDKILEERTEQELVNLESMAKEKDEQLRRKIAWKLFRKFGRKEYALR